MLNIAWNHCCINQSVLVTKALDLSEFYIYNATWLTSGQVIGHVCQTHMIFLSSVHWHSSQSRLNHFSPNYKETVHNKTLVTLPWKNAHLLYITRFCYHKLQTVICQRVTPKWNVLIRYRTFVFKGT